MKHYLAQFVEPLGTAALTFPFVAFLTLLPFVLVHYRRHGRVHPWRALVTYSFLFYLLAAAFLVSLPLPDRPGPSEVSAWLAHHSAARQPRWDPTGFVTDILQASPGHRFSAVLQAVFNLLLLLPFGFYLVYAFRRSPLGAWVGGLLLSLVFEVSQLTGLFGFYPGPYRLFDTGDLFLNSTGALLGAWAAALLVRFKLLPELSSLSGPTTPWIGAFRRAIAFGTDLTALLVTALAGALVAEALGIQTDPTGPALVGATVLWMILVPALDGGQGPGRRLTVCAIRKKQGPAASPGRILARQALVWGPPLGMVMAADGPWGPSVVSGALLVALVWGCGFLWSLGGLVFHKEHAGWLDRRLGLRVRNTWKQS